MADKIAVITGSSKGIGFGYARELLRRDFHVTVCGRDQAAADAAREQLIDEQLTWREKLLAMTCNVAVLSDVQGLWNTTQQHFGTPTLWINNAGFARSGPTLLELSPDEIEHMVETNLIGTIHGCQVAVQGMLKAGEGYLINTLGGGAKGQVVKGMIGYSTTKRAVKAITDSLRKELKGKPIRISTVSPGVNLTEGMLREIRALPPGEREKTIKPLNIIGDRVETTTPWLIDRLLEGEEHRDVSWLTGGKLMGRFLLAPFKKRDLLSGYRL